jgi:SNF2 family DNA or RNA helicase
MKVEHLSSGRTTSKTALIESGYFSSRLDDFQKDAVRFILRQKTVGIFAEQGTGKTWIALAALEQLIAPDFAGLLVCQKNNKETTWLDLMPHLGVNFTNKWEEFKKLPSPRLMVLHFEELRKKSTIGKLRRFGLRWDAIVVDECHRAANRGNILSRRLRILRQFGEFRIALSGTPVESSPADIWAQMRFINPQVFGENWGTFDKTYQVKSGFKGFGRSWRDDRMPRFMRLLKPWALRITKDVLDLPPMHVRIHKVDMSERQEALYDEMRSRRAIDTPTGEVAAPLAITRDIRLAQIASGYVQTPEGYFWLSDVKRRRARAVLKRCFLPAVVFFRFIPEMVEVAKWLKPYGTVATYSGKTKNKPQVQRAFQAGEIDFLLCQSRAGGTGLDLFTARTVMVYSNDWSSITFDQLMARVHRRGQTEEVDAHILLTRNTIDARIYKRVCSKLSNSRNLLDQLRR